MMRHLAQVLTSKNMEGPGLVMRFGSTYLLILEFGLNCFGWVSTVCFCKVNFKPIEQHLTFPMPRISLLAV